MMPLVLDRVVQARGTGRRRTRVLEGVSLAVAEGECVLVEGPSGSGKTTLLGVAAGLLTPSSGVAWLAGEPLSALPHATRSRLRARALGFVFQRANLLEGLTAIHNVMLAARLAGRSAGEARRDAQQLLERLQIDHLAERYPRELSGGEEQRVAVARALVHSPAVLLADEPTGSLDAASGDVVVRELLALAREQRAAVVLATHDIRLAALAARRLRLFEGRLDGT